jgi:hypothetical protein
MTASTEEAVVEPVAETPSVVIADSTSEFGSDVEPVTAEEIHPVDEPEVSATDDIDRLDPPPPDDYTMTDGVRVLFQRLRTRQFFKLLRIVTRGAGNMLGLLRLSPGQSIDDFTNNLIAVIVLAIPEAEEETIEFLRSMVEPVPPAVPDETPPAQVGKVAASMVADARKKLDASLDNPELDDLLGIVEAIVRREAPDLKALGKRLVSTIELAQKTGQIPQDATAAASSEDSPARSI